MKASFIFMIFITLGMIAAMTPSRSASAGPLFGSDFRGTGNLITINTGTGAGVGGLGGGFTGVAGLAYDSNTSILYGFDASTDNLLTIDQSSGAGTIVGPLGVDFPDVGGMAFDPNANRLYLTLGVGGGRGLYTVNTGTGAASFIGNTGVNIPGLAFDPNTNTLFGVSGQTDRLYTSIPLQASVQAWVF